MLVISHGAFSWETSKRLNGKIFFKWLLLGINGNILYSYHMDVIHTWHRPWEPANENETACGIPLLPFCLNSVFGDALPSQHWTALQKAFDRQLEGICNFLNTCFHPIKSMFAACPHEHLQWLQSIMHVACELTPPPNLSLRGQFSHLFFTPLLSGT